VPSSLSKISCEGTFASLCAVPSLAFGSPFAAVLAARWRPEDHIIVASVASSPQMAASSSSSNRSTFSPAAAGSQSWDRANTGNSWEQRLTEGAPMSGSTPRGRLDRRKLQNKPIRNNPARMVLNLILEDVMVKIEDSVRLSEMRKAKALAIESLKRDAAIFRFRQTGMITVTNAVSGNVYEVVLDKPGIHVLYERTTRQLYEKVRLAVPALPRSSSLCIWYETGSGKSLQQFPIRASVYNKVENFAGRPLFVIFK
jgi:hypothetical protein